MHGYRILFVDDDEPIRGWFLVFAENIAAECRAAASGAEALAILEHFEPEVLIADLHMPTMGGLELIHLAKARYPHLVAIVLTGMGSREDTIASIKEGVFDFIEKPVQSLDVFLMAIQRAGEHARMQRERGTLLDHLRVQNEELQTSLSELKHAYEQLRRRDAALLADLESAQRMQQRMLPAALPPAGNVSCFGYYCPCSWVGGDFFDSLALDGGRRAFYLADVSGHGVRAALVTVILRELIHGELAARTRPGLFDHPEAALGWLNRALRGQGLGEACLVTLGYVLLDSTRGQIVYASAGHPAPLLRVGDGGWERVDAEGPALGVDEDAEFQAVTLDFPPGSALLLYSDGLGDLMHGLDCEPSADEEEASAAERLESELQRDPHGSAQRIGSEVERIFSEQLQGSAPPDDVSFIVLHHALATAAVASDAQNAPALSARPQPTVKMVNLEHLQERPASSVAYLATGWATQCFVVRLVGRGTWKLGPQFLQLVQEALAHQPATVYLDLSACTSLDSTLLGLLYQLGPMLTVHGPSPRVLDQLREVGIERHLTISTQQPPEVTYTVQQQEEVCQPWEQSRLMLHAHELLSTLGQENRERFSAVVEMLSMDVQQP